MRIINKVKNKIILIISNKSDITTDLVIKKLQSRKINYFRFNTEDFPKNIISQISNGNEIFESYLKTSKRVIPLEDIYSVWYRRPKISDVSSLNIQNDDKAFILREIDTYLQNLWAVLSDRLWINNPFSLIKAEKKAFQLFMAKKIGLKIPTTIVTNSPDDFERFNSDYDRQVIVKPISHGGFGKNDESAIFTTDLEPIETIDKSNIPLSPFILQEKIKNKFDVRITVFGEKVFAYKILPYKKLNVDWRRYKPNEIKYLKIAVPSNIKQKLYTFMNKLNLKFGAFDFIVDKNNNWIFIEVNPSGQFAWLEFVTKDKIIDSFINLLMGKYEKL